MTAENNKSNVGEIVSYCPEYSPDNGVTWRRLAPVFRPVEYADVVSVFPPTRLACAAAGKYARETAERIGVGCRWRTVVVEVAAEGVAGGAE